MASEWKKHRIKDVVSFVVDNRGKTPPTQDEGHMLLEVNAVSATEKFPLYREVRKHVSQEVYDTRFRKGHPKKGDILVPTVGTLGAVSLMDRDDCCIAQNLIAIRCDEAICHSHFLYYVLCNPMTRKRLLNLNIGGVQPSIKVPHLMELEIALPSIREQKKIAELLSLLDDKIFCNKRINDNLQEQAQTLFAERFCLRNSDPVPEGWSLVSLGDVAVISNKSFNPLKQPETMLEHYSIPAFDETRYPVFELSTEIKSNKFIVDSDCFMISKLNPTTKRVWRPYCMTENAVCSTEFIVYKAKVRELTDFLYSLIDSASFSDFMCSHVTGSTGSRQRTTPSDTLQYQFYMPTADEIADFSAVVAPMYAQIRINALENARLKELRDSLLPRLMSGDIDVSEVSI